MARRNKSQEREMALDRIRQLVGFAQAEQRQAATQTSPGRYVKLARRIAMRYQVSLPTELRRRICRGCDTLLVSGRTARHRIANGRVTVTCLQCGALKRYPIRPKPGVTS